MDGVVTALRPADRPRNARIVGALGRSVVAPFPELAADGTDRRQVQDVEAKLAYVVEARR